jgi:flagellar assembly protein FliH
MQSLYNVIKGNNVVAQGEKEIRTEFLFPRVIKNNNTSYEANEIDSSENRAREMEAYEALVKTMVANARRQSEEILSKAFEEAQRLEKEAYEKAYAEGQENGYTDAYNEMIPQAAAEAEAIIENAKALLLEAKLQYETYLEDKKDEILKLSVSIAEHILKRELKSKDGLNELIYETIKESRNSDTFIIRVGKLYVDEIKVNIEKWKESLGLKADIFIVPDESINEGNAVIEKNNGKIEVGIDTGLKSIKDELL